MATYLGIFPYARSLKHLTREANFINAMEMREKQLLSQTLCLFQGRVDEIHYDTDHIMILDYSNPSTILPHMREIARTSPFAQYAHQRHGGKAAAAGGGGAAGTGTGAGAKAPHWRSKKAALQTLSQSVQDSSAPRLFAYGNTTVLCWGRVHQYAPLTYNAHHVYPVGFACIRQEHDLLLDKVRPWLAWKCRT